MNRDGSAAVKLVNLEPPTGLKDEDFKGPIDGDGDDGDSFLQEVNIDIADNGFLVSFVHEFGDVEKTVVLAKDELLELLRKRL